MGNSNRMPYQEAVSKVALEPSSPISVLRITGVPGVTRSKGAHPPVSIAFFAEPHLTRMAQCPCLCGAYAG